MRIVHGLGNCKVAVALPLIFFALALVGFAAETSSNGTSHNVGVVSGSSWSSARDGERTVRSATQVHDVVIGGFGGIATTSGGAYRTELGYLHQWTAPEIASASPASGMQDEVKAFDIVARNASFRDVTSYSISSTSYSTDTTFTVTPSPGWTTNEFAGEWFLPDAKGTVALKVKSNTASAVVVAGDVEGLAGSSLCFVARPSFELSGAELKVVSLYVVTANLMQGQVEIVEDDDTEAAEGEYTISTTTPYDVDGGTQKLVAPTTLEVFGTGEEGKPQVEWTSPSWGSQHSGAGTAVATTVQFTDSWDYARNSLAIWSDKDLAGYPAGKNLVESLGMTFGDTGGGSPQPNATGAFSISDLVDSGVQYVTLYAAVSDQSGNPSDVAVVRFVADENATDFGTNRVVSVSPQSIRRDDSATTITVTFANSLSADISSLTESPAGLDFSSVSGLTGETTLTFSAVATSGSSPLGEYVVWATDASSKKHYFPFTLDIEDDGGNGVDVSGAGSVFTRRETEANQPPTTVNNPGFVAVGVSPAGEFVYPIVPIAIPTGHGPPLIVGATYRSGNTYDGPLGPGWDISFNKRVEFIDDTTDAIRFHNGAGQAFDFLKSGSAYFIDGRYDKIEVIDQTDGSVKSTAPVADDWVRMTDRHGNTMVFRPFANDQFSNEVLGAAVDRITDRNGNTLRFVYNAIDQLVSMVSADGNALTISYDAESRVSTIVDFSSDWDYRSSTAAREWTFNYTTNTAPDPDTTVLASIEYPETDRFNSGNSRVKMTFAYDSHLNGVTADNFLCKVRTPVEVAKGVSGKDELEVYYKDFSGVAKVEKQKLGIDDASADKFIYITYVEDSESGSGASTSGSVLTPASSPGWGDLTGRTAVVNGVSCIVTSNTASTLTVDRTLGTQSNVDWTVCGVIRELDRKGHKRECHTNAGNAFCRVVDYAKTWVAPTGTTVDQGKVNSSNPDTISTLISRNQHQEVTEVIFPEGNSAAITLDDGNADHQSQGNLQKIVLTPDSTRGGEQSTITVGEWTYTNDQFRSVSTFVSSRGFDANDALFTSETEQQRKDRVTTRFSYDLNGNCVLVEAPTTGACTIRHHTAYDGCGCAVAFSDGSRVDTVDYHHTGPLRGFVEQTTFDAGGRNLVTKYDRNSVGMVTGVTDPRGNATGLLPNELGQYVLMKGPSLSSYGGGVNWIRQFYTRDGMLEQVEVAAIDHDGTGPTAAVASSPAALTSTNLAITKYTRNLENLPTEIERNVSGTETIKVVIEYDDSNNAVLVKSPVANLSPSHPDYDANNRVRRIYDDYDRLYQIVEADGATSDITIPTTPTNSVDVEALTEILRDDNGDIVEIRQYRELSYSPVIKTFLARTGTTLTGDDGKLVTSITRDGYGRPVLVEDDALNRLKLEYDAASNVVATSHAAYDSGGNHDLLSAVTCAYDELNRKTDQSVLALDSGHGVTITSSQCLGDISGAINSAATTHKLGDNTGAWTELDWTYNCEGRLSSCSVAGDTTSFVYDQAGVLMTTILPEDNNQIWNFYNHNLDLVRQEEHLRNSADGSLFVNTTTLLRDELNRVYQVIDNDGSTTTIERGWAGPEEITDPNNYRIDRAYDLLGRGIKDTYVGTTIEVETDWDANSRIASKTDPENNVESRKHDARNRVIELTNAESKKKTFIYDDANNIVYDKNEVGTEREYAYHPNANLVSTVDVKTLATGFIGETARNYEWDVARGLCTRFANFDNTGDEIHEALFSGHNTLGICDSSTEQLALTSVHSGGLNDNSFSARTFTRVIDEKGLSAGMQYSSHTAMSPVETVITRDGMGRIETVEDPLFTGTGEEWSVDEYLGYTPIAGTQPHGNLSVRIELDQDLAPVSKTYSTVYSGGSGHDWGVDGITTQAVTLTYDPAKNITSQANAEWAGYKDVYDYSNDALYRLETATYWNVETGGMADDINYTQDVFTLTDGNDRDSTTVKDGAGDTLHTVDYTGDGGYGEAMHEYATVDGVSYTYDDCGNLTSDGTYTYEYNANNQLVRIKVGTDVLVEYIYDCRNLLVAVLYGSEGTGTGRESYSNGSWSGMAGCSYYYAMYSGNTPLEEGEIVLNGTYGDYYLTEASEDYLHVYAGRSVLDGSHNVPGQLDGSNNPLTFTTGTNTRGDVKVLYDADGNPVERYGYDAFGNMFATPNVASGPWTSGASVSYDSGTDTTTITGSFNASSSWVGYSFRVDILGESDAGPGEFVVSAYTSSTSFKVKGKLLEPDDNTVWEVVALNAYDVTAVSYNGTNDETTITFASAPTLEDQSTTAGDDELIGAWARLSIHDGASTFNQDFYSLRARARIVDNDESSKTITLEGDWRDFVTTSDYVQVFPRQSRYGFQRLWGDLTWHGGIVTLASGALHSLAGLHYAHNRWLDPVTGRFITRDPAGTWYDNANNGNAYTYCGNDSVNGKDPSGLDTVVVHWDDAWHTAIGVDTYDAEGNRIRIYISFYMGGGGSGCSNNDLSSDGCNSSGSSSDGGCSSGSSANQRTYEHMCDPSFLPFREWRNRVGDDRSGTTGPDGPVAWPDKYEGKTENVDRVLDTNDFQDALIVRYFRRLAWIAMDYDWIQFNCRHFSYELFEYISHVRPPTELPEQFANLEAFRAYIREEFDNFGSWTEDHMATRYFGQNFTWYERFFLEDLGISTEEQLRELVCDVLGESGQRTTDTDSGVGGGGELRPVNPAWTGID